MTELADSGYEVGEILIVVPGLRRPALTLKLERKGICEGSKVKKGKKGVK